MIHKFNTQKANKILFCIVDNFSLMTSGWAKEIAMNISDFSINRMSMREYDIYIGNNEEKLLKSAADDGYEYAVMVACGTTFKMSERIFDAIEELCSRDFYIAGHIIDRGDRYYEVHHQFYVVHLPEYIELGYPIIGAAVAESHTTIEPQRSVEGIWGESDLPLHVSPGTIERLYSEKMHGWHLFSNAMSNNKTVIDLGENVRNNKKYLYYEYDHVFLREMQDIYYQQFFCNSVFFPWNTDGKIPMDQSLGPVEQYITVGTGLNWVRNINNIGYTDDTIIKFTDINQNCLQFMRELVTEWDGIDYIEFYKQRMKANPNNNPFNVNNYGDSWSKQFDEFVNTFDDWLTVWNKIKQLKYEFIHIDYTATHNLDFIEGGKRTIMNLSDLYNHVPYVATQSLKYRIACENRLILKLQNKVPDATLLLTSRASDGFDAIPKLRMGYVKDFTVTDINLLKRPVWHQSDWNSPRPLI